MALRQRTLIFLGVILILSSFQERAEGVRLCGRRLADLLNFICEKHGGFHAPIAKRDVMNKSSNKRAVIEIIRPIPRRADLDASGEESPESVIDGEITFHYQSGIVDECCKKPCTLATMVSYCASVQHVGNFNLEDILPHGILNLPSITEEDLAEYQVNKVPSEDSLDSPNVVMSHPMTLTNHVVYSSRPNLGLSPRNRPVFIVLSQLQEDEDRALGEYRF